MKNIISVFTLVLFAQLCLFAQKATVQLSPEFKLPKSKVFSGHLHSDASGHYVYFYDFSSRKEATVILEKFDPKFKLTYSKEFKSGKDYTTSLGIKYLQNGFAWLVSERNDKEDYLKYYLAPISYEGKLGKLSQVAKFNYERKRDAPTANWITSADSTKVLFTAVDDKDDDEEKVGIYLSVLDNKFEVLWDKKLKLSKMQDMVKIDEWSLAANGDVFMLAKVYEGNKAKESKKGKKGKVANYQMKLYHFKKDNPDPVQYDLKLGDSFIKGSTISFNKAGEMICIGFFSNTLGGSTTGVFFMRLNPADGSVLAVNKHDFSSKDLDILGEDNTSKDKEGEEGIDNSFSFKDILFKSDGSTLVTAEENYSVTTSHYNGRTWTTTTTYYSKDIIAININSEGKITNTTLIPKRQRFGTDVFEYFTTLVNKDDVYFFYNEDEDNLKKPIGTKTKYISSFKDCTAVMTRLSADGKLDRKLILDPEDAEVLFIPKNSRQFNDNQLFFVGMKFRLFGASDFRMGVVSLVNK
jgi:hypothetical protein